jgi:hypothetical protein
MAFLSGGNNCGGAACTLDGASTASANSDIGKEDKGRAIPPRRYMVNVKVT